MKKYSRKLSNREKKWKNSWDIYMIQNLYKHTEKHVWLRWKLMFLPAVFHLKRLHSRVIPFQAKGVTQAYLILYRIQLQSCYIPQLSLLRQAPLLPQVRRHLPSSFSESQKITPVTSGIFEQCSWTIPVQRSGRGKLLNSLPWLGKFGKK